MTNYSLRSSSKRLLFILALVLIPAVKVLAQDSPLIAAMKSDLVQPAAVQPAAEPVFATTSYGQPSYLQPSYVEASYVQPTESREMEHRFWDRENSILFAAVGASAAADFCVTRANLASGGRELNPVTRVFAGSTTGLAFNFIGETVGSMGISYFFHKTGHHRLERLTSLVNMGNSGFAVTYGLTHR
jgi:hypothetical protein